VLLAFLDWQVAWGGTAVPAPLRRLCNVAREDGLAAWVATVQAAALACVAWLYWGVVRRRRAARFRRIGWLASALVLSWVAVDDGARVHEALGSMFDALLERARRDPEVTGIAAWLGRYPSYGWQLVVLPPLALGGAGVFVFLARELTGRRARSLLVGVVFALGMAVAMDFVEGLDREHPWNAYARVAMIPGLDDWSHRRFEQSAWATVLHSARVLEELLEIAAGSVLLALLVDHLGSARPGAAVQVEPGTAQNG
jgi:hypothetical protein